MFRPVTSGLHAEDTANDDFAIAPSLPNGTLEFSARRMVNNDHAGPSAIVSTTLAARAFHTWIVSRGVVYEAGRLG